MNRPALRKLAVEEAHKKQCYIRNCVVINLVFALILLDFTLLALFFNKAGFWDTLGSVFGPLAILLIIYLDILETEALSP